ncbi:bifunctional glycosyltransferase/CDP-glycerol:glycerophosphate glycerophosphotransferase [Nocardioides pantholopis]|uniref:bifunctional glycosyltransferase/CDP-glycerol:glycerophosphate glycerophosphotransferase n=1 Tax=Nocardioides pantholopis TaxID=2483798 RepID=UPI000FD705CF|nr:glycosyltransferase [Nocardioides pantholopis]
MKQPVRFSIVAAVYNVSRYLEDFIASVEAQRGLHSQLEVIAVDDGSTDDSLERLRRWERESDIAIRVLHQPNGGQSSARNHGIEHATGEWVTFLDPDDRMQPKYLRSVADFLDEHPEVDMVATNRWMLDDATGELTNSHPLRSMFRDGNVVRDLTEMPDYFHGSAPSAFVRRDRLEQLGLRFDPEVRPNFEDGHFCSSYLLDLDHPRVGFVRTAHYVYRKRADASSTLQGSLENPDRYTQVLEHGYLDLLRRGAQRHGRAPGWLQSFVLYELSWYFSSHDAKQGRTAARGEVADRFHELLAQIVALLDPELVAGFWRRGIRREWRAALLHAYADQPWHDDHAVITAVDPARRLYRVSYLFTGPAPREQAYVGGAEVALTHAKTRDLASHDRVLLHERLLWLPASKSLRLHVDGRAIPVLESEPPVPGSTLYPRTPQRLIRERTGQPEPGPALSAEDQRLVTKAASRRVRKEFADAWVLVDRVHDADDSAEHLFHHLRSERPDVNAFFVLEEGTADWRRLRPELGKRLVAFGSERWKLLMLNAAHLISSHADRAIVDAPGVPRVPRTWRFTFLQHGVIKDDLSPWLNTKSIDVFVTSTHAEHESIVGDHTRYSVTTKETVLTGLPRFDRLLEAGRDVPETGRDLVVLAPTWRRWLVPHLDPASQRRDDLGPEFFESEFLRSWLDLLADPELAQACADRGLTLAFLPHPNLQPALPLLDLPAHVRPLSYEGADVRRLVARSALLVTDYSSMAFNAGYIDRQVLYYQFDAERALSGDHVGADGYFDYERDGFGPVAHTHADAVREACAAIAGGPVPAATYLERNRRTFTLRDGGCCRRVTEAIEVAGRETPVGAVVGPPR